MNETGAKGEPQPTALDRFLRLFSDVRAGEGANALILLGTIFTLLFAYYVLKTVREPLVLVSATEDLSVLTQWGLPSWLTDVILDRAGGAQVKAVAAAGQALVLLAYVPLYSWVASRVSRVRLIVSVSLFFVFCIEGFFVLRLLGAPLLGFFFYVWLGVFGVSMPAQFWSFGNDVYTEEAGKRLFPVIGVGATAGSPVGSKAAGMLYAYLAPEPNARGMHEGLDGFQRWVIDSELDPTFILLQVPALLLLVFMSLMLWAAKRTTSAAPARDDSEPKATEPKNSESGLAMVLRSPYLRLIGAVILTLNLVNTTGEFILSEHVTQEAARRVAAGEITNAGAWIGRFYGDFFTWVNIAGLVLQAFVVSRLVKHFGVRGVLFALPLVALGSYALFAAGFSLAVLRWAKTAENATDYSIMNTGKALVWLPTSRAAKYKAKQAVDTLLVRIGDVASAVLFLVATMALALDTRALAFVVLALVAVWLFLTYRLSAHNAALTNEAEGAPNATG